MRIAYLVLAHHQPRHLARLAGVLLGEGACFFVHVDRKVEIRAFQEQLPPAENVVYLEGPNRTTVYWGGFSTIVATLNLVRRARTDRPGYHRYCLLSGADFPIAGRSRIEEKLGSDIEYLRIDRRLDDPRARLHRTYVSRYHLLDFTWLNPRSSPFPRLPEATRRLLARVSRPSYPHLRLYHGSQWWCLTEACVDWVLAYLERNPAYLRFHRYTRLPDEIFFHSIIKASPYEERVSHDFERAEDVERHLLSNEYGCHFIDWHADTVFLPRVLEESDLPALLASEALFARKFEERRSAVLLDRLEESFGE